MLEEEVIVQHILNLDLHSFPPWISNVKDMANHLLQAWNQECIGKNWTLNFVQQQPQLQSCFNQRIDYQRALCEDPDVYNTWFRLV